MWRKWSKNRAASREVGRSLLWPLFESSSGTRQYGHSLNKDTLTGGLWSKILLTYSSYLRLCRLGNKGNGDKGVCQKIEEMLSGKCGQMLQKGLYKGVKEKKFSSKRNRGTWQQEIRTSNTVNVKQLKWCDYHEMIEHATQDCQKLYKDLHPCKFRRSGS